MTKTISTSILIHLLFTSLLFNSCEGKSKPSDDDGKATQAIKPVSLSNKITCMIQDNAGTYWFGSSGEGVYRYDGKSLVQFSTKEGLCSDFIQTIQEDNSGNLWIETSNGICKYNGNGFTNYTYTLKNAPQSNAAPEKGSLFFSHNGFVYHWNGKSFSNLIIHPKAYQPESTNLDRPYGIYCGIEDNKGNFWFGTDQKGVCRYNGKSIIYFTEKGLNGAAVRTIFQDNSGNIWFGNNGYGLFCYNGKSLTNFTEEHGLDNPHFLRKANSVNKSKT